MIIPEHINPTAEFYRLLLLSYDHFNTSLFTDTLPACMITLQRQRNTMGYFSEERWCSTNGHKAHEIALNPAYFANHRIVDVLQTLVHEQCHLWQYVHGQCRSRSGYHNREWAEKMEVIGLIASDSGEPGGKRTGQTMSDYPAPGGKFLQACESLVQTGFNLTWVDTLPALSESCQLRLNKHELNIFDGVGQETVMALTRPVANMVAEIDTAQHELRLKKSQSKSKYFCPGCNTNVWGKPGLNIRCGDCQTRFEFVV